MAKIKIRAEKIEMVHLSPGDMFSLLTTPFRDIDSLFAADIQLRLSGPVPPDLKDVVVLKLTVTGNAKSKAKSLTFRMDPHIPPGFKEEI